MYTHSPCTNALLLFTSSPYLVIAIIVDVTKLLRSFTPFHFIIEEKEFPILCQRITHSIYTVPVAIIILTLSNACMWYNIIVMCA